MSNFLNKTYIKRNIRWGGLLVIQLSCVKSILVNKVGGSHLSLQILTTFNIQQRIYHRSLLSSIKKEVSVLKNEYKVSKGGVQQPRSD